MRFSTGARLGTYEILAPIGVGGMGEVYRARDTRLKREVAVKVISGPWVGDADRLMRFQREAELLAALTHPNIAVIYGVEEWDGVTALVLEMVEGPTLGDRLVQGPVPLAEALAIGRQIIDALDAAHEGGIVHRDLKPANIKIREDGAVKVLDFGLAKVLDSDAPRDVDATASPTLTSPAMTRLGVILGTAAYMSPEQARGQGIDKRTDIWAFGCVLYEMLAGRSAFARATVPDTIAAILEREPDWSALPAQIPTRVRQLLRRCLEKDRKRRLRDIGDARYQLDEAESETVHSHGAARRLRWPYVVAGATILTALVAIAVLPSVRSAPRAQTVGPALGQQFSRVTTDASFSSEPALSSDGAFVVYASDRASEGQLDLWLQRTSGGQPIRLTDDPADDRQPSFSPDGSLIAFRSDRGGGGIYVMPALGGDARLVAEGGRQPRFSPDSGRIAYWTGPWLSGAGARGPRSAVFTVPARGGQPTQIAADFTSARDPVWSPDGRSLLFFGRRLADASPQGLFDWWWAPLDGGDPVASGAYRVLASMGLLEGADNDARNVTSDAMPAAWTATGVYFSARLGESLNLWRLGVSERTGQAIETSLERLTRGSGSDRVPSVDRSGRIAFQVAAEGRVSLTLPLDANAGKASGAIIRRSFEAALDSGGRNSLDDAGRLLVYPKRSSGEGEIWVKDLTTGQERHLVTASSSPLNPVISHDGTKVAYTVFNRETAEGYVVSTTGGTARKVCDGCNLHGWFADDRRILFLNTTPGIVPGRARVLDVIDGKTLDLLVDATAGIGRVDVSPNGRWISFSGSRQVWIAPLRPGDPPQRSEWVSVHMIADDSAERACGWSPDGRLLYLLLERDGFRDLYAQRVDPLLGRPTGEPFIVQHLHDPPRSWGSTPYGTAIVSDAFVFNQMESTGTIWLLDTPSTGADASSREQ